jgi:hypothetical protein
MTRNGLDTRQCPQATGAEGQGPPLNRTAFFGDYTYLTKISPPVRAPLESTTMSYSGSSEPDVEEMIK